MIQKIKNKIRDKKGMSTIEFVLCMIIFVIVTAFIIDLFIVSYKHYIVTTNCTKAARVISIQGGLGNGCPDNYPGGNSNYMTNREFRTYLNELADTVQSTTGEFRVYIEYSYIDNNDNIVEKKDILVYQYKKNTNGAASKTYYPQDFILPYGSFITLRFEYTYAFLYTNLYNGNNDNFKFHSSKSYVSEYVSYDYGYHINGQKILTAIPDVPVVEGGVSTKPSSTDGKYFIRSGNAIIGLSTDGQIAHDNNLLNNLVIPEKIDDVTISRIEDGAFAGCTKIDSISISSKVQYIGRNAFAGCINLSRFDYYEGLEKIDAQAFSGCTSLSYFGPAYSYKDLDKASGDVPRIILPRSLEELGSLAFENCVKIKKVRIGDRIVKIANDAFNGTCEK